MGTRETVVGIACARILPGALAIGLAVVAAPVATVAQPPELPTFDVASVRLSIPEKTRSTQQLTDSRIALIDQPLSALLLLAFRAKDYQLSMPDWVQSVHVDVQATLPRGGTRQQIPEMLQALLVQRFGLGFHREHRLTEVYELVVDKSGTKMEEVAPLNELNREFPVDPGFTSGAGADRVTETLGGPVRTVMGEMGRTTITARSMYQMKLTDRRTQVLNATRMTMAEFAAVLGRVTGRPVLDKTNLGAHYKFTIELPPNNALREAAERRGIDPNNLGPSVAVPPIELTSKAVTGLGLRLERRRSQVETIVVDRIERTPTDN